MDIQWLFWAILWISKIDFSSFGYPILAVFSPLLPTLKVVTPTFLKKIFCKTAVAFGQKPTFLPTLPTFCPLLKTKVGADFEKLRY